MSMIFRFQDWTLLGSPGTLPVWLSIGVGWVIGVIMTLVLALLFTPLLNKIKEQVGLKVSKSQDLTSLLRQYSQSITNILDLNLLATVAVGTASELMEVQRGYLFLVDFEKGSDSRNEFRLHGVKGMGNVNPEPGILREQSPVSVYFRQEHKPLTRSDLDLQRSFQGITPEERKWLNSLGAEIYVPIYVKNDWIGLLVLGPKISGSTFTAQDLAFLSTMADQTAVALQNTRLVEGLIRLNNEFRQAYAALDKANRHLERLDQAKSDFINIASHELRTPLTLISGASQMLIDDPELKENSYYQQVLSRMHAGTVRLHKIVDSVLDMANIDTRTMILEPQPVSMQSLIRMVCEEFSRDANERKQKIIINDLEGLPLIQGDVPTLKKVFSHLIINAIKYTPDGGRITISGRELKPEPLDLPDGGVEIVVSDTGIGIDPRFQELIFVKFYQAGVSSLHSSGKTKFKGGGPGLGLAIARGIVEAHQGKIWVESSGYDEKKCPGSRFFVVLPLRQAGRIQMHNQVEPAKPNLETPGNSAKSR